MIQPEIQDGKATFPDIYPTDCWKVGQRLKIGKIINHKGDEVSSLMLEPQGIAHLVSEECVHLSENVCALAHVLTGLCNEGLLTLNIGVVDPGWHNHLSTPVLNFSSERRLLQKGNYFIRITFHQIEHISSLGKDRFANPMGGVAGYEREIKARAVGGFGKTFLNVRQLVAKASAKENARFREAMLKYLPIGAFSLAIFALLVTTGIATITRLSGADKQQEILERLDRLERSMEKGVAARATAPIEDPDQSPPGGTRP